MTGLSASNPLRVAVAGSRGRMGSMAVEAINAESDLKLVLELTRQSVPADALDREKVDVLLDLSLAATSRTIAPLAARRGIAPVVGVSGWNADDLACLREACREGRVGGLVVPNFSLGAVQQMRAAEELAAILDGSTIHEIHHPAKQDMPSGTALNTAERMHRAALQRDPAAARPEITSERTEGVLARQVVTFESGGERIVLDHEVRDRAAYMPGVLLALRSVRHLAELQVGLEVALDSSLARAREGLV